MSYVEPAIPLAISNSEEPRGSTPRQTDTIDTRTRAIINRTFKLPTYITGTDEPVAVPMPSDIGAPGRAIVTIENNGGAAGAVIARYWLDGSWPTAARGIPLKDGASFTINGQQDILNFRIVSADTHQHTIQVQFFNS